MDGNLEEFYEETFETWNNIANLYQTVFMDMAIYNNSYQIFIDKFTKQNVELFEIGCGPGNISKYILGQKPNWLLSGIDIAENMVELAKTNNPSGDYWRMDCRQIDLLSQKFDAIMAGFCIPYLSKVYSAKLLADCHFLLRDNGYLYISFVEGNYSRSGFLQGSSGHRTYFYFYSLEEIKELLKRASFSIENEIIVPYQKRDLQEEKHIIVIAKKN